MIQNKSLGNFLKPTCKMSVCGWWSAQTGRQVHHLAPRTSRFDSPPQNTSPQPWLGVWGGSSPLCTTPHINTSSLAENTGEESKVSPTDHLSKHMSNLSMSPVVWSFFVTSLSGCDDSGRASDSDQAGSLLDNWHVGERQRGMSNILGLSQAQQSISTRHDRKGFLFKQNTQKLK